MKYAREMSKFSGGLNALLHFAFNYYRAISPHAHFAKSKMSFFFYYLISNTRTELVKISPFIL